MDFKVKNLKISTGDTLVAILNKYDAIEYDLYSMDRIGISNGKGNTITAVIDTTESDKLVPRGTLGVFEELHKALRLRGVKTVRFKVEKKPESIRLIRKKLNGKKLNYREFYRIIEDIINNKLTSIEMTYFVSGCYINELTTKEVFNLTRAMIETGETLSFDNKIIMDKHCVGGVAGNRTTLIVTAIIAAAGYIIPKTSSRSITSAAGTADTMEQLCKVEFSSDQLKRIVKKTNGCIVWGGALNLAPADDKIIRVESPISLDPTGQLIASVLAKKKSVSANHVLIDIPVGRGAKIESGKEAKSLKRKFQKVGRLLGMKTKVIITDGSSPVGNGVGPVLEAKDVIYTLKNDVWGSLELKNKSIYLAGIMLGMAGHKNGMKMAKEILDSGKAYEKFVEIIKAQGGREKDPDRIRLGKYNFDFHSTKTGVVTHIDNRIVNRIARIAGAPIDTRAGVYLNVYKQKVVRDGDKLFTVYSDNKQRLEFAKEHMDKNRAIEIND